MVEISRRDLSWLLPALALPAAAQEKPLLPSKAYRFEDLAVRDSAGNHFRNILNGGTHKGFAIELHETELAAGAQPHDPHQHANEELLLIREGTLDVMISGKTTRLGPGSVAYMASNELHGWRNNGSAPARYFVLALGI